MNNQTREQNYELFLKQLKENQGWYLALGVSLVVLGTLAIVYSFLSTLFSVVYFGFLLLGIGIFEAVKAFKVNQWTNFFLHAFLSFLYILAGIFIISNPAVNAITLTLLLAFFFIASGIAKVIFALTQKVPHKTWVVLSGVLTFILGVLIWQQWPYSGLWAIGLLVGIDTVFTGWTWIMLSLQAKKLTV